MRLFAICILFLSLLDAQSLKVMTLSKEDGVLLGILNQQEETFSSQKGRASQNITLLKEKKCNLAISHANCAYLAYHEAKKSAKETPPTLRSIVALYPKMLTFITTKEHNLSSFKDIQADLSHIAIQDQNSSCSSILTLLDIDLNNTFQDFEAAQKALHKGTIDGFFTLIAHPDSKVTKLTQENNITFTPLFGKRFDQINNDYPYIKKGGIPKGLYTGVDHDIKSIGVKALLLTRADVNESVIYHITKTILKNIEAFKKANPIYRGISKKDLLEGLAIPQHKGAIKAFNEPSE